MIVFVRKSALSLLVIKTFSSNKITCYRSVFVIIYTMLMFSFKMIYLIRKKYKVVI